MRALPPKPIFYYKNRCHAESRIGIPGSKHIYLGLFDDEPSAARAYDGALVRIRGGAAATNFSLGEYRKELAEYHEMQQASSDYVAE